MEGRTTGPATCAPGRWPSCWSPWKVCSGEFRYPFPANFKTSSSTCLGGCRITTVRLLIFKPPGGADTRRTPAAVDWSVNEVATRLVAAPHREAKAGLACYAAVRLRNTLLHVLENNLQIYADEAKCLDMFGISLAAYRVTMDREGRIVPVLARTNEAGSQA